MNFLFTKFYFILKFFYLDGAVIDRDESDRWVCSVLCNRIAAARTFYEYSMLILCFLTALLWGITNWFLKEGSTGLQKIHYDNRIKQFGAEIWYFFTNAQVLKTYYFNENYLLIFVV